MKSFIKTLAVLGLIYGASCTAPKSLDFYSLSAKDIQGNEISLEQYKGKVSQRTCSAVHVQKYRQVLYLIYCSIIRLADIN